ncbi:MAG: phage tail protein I [Desulfovibrionaceae bacterium]
MSDDATVASLLPDNATAQEIALAKTTARIGDVPTLAVRAMWNPDTCPAALLPWLAWALSVDMWDDAWPEARKRAVIKASVAVHRIKGTPAAVEGMLAALGFDAGLVEWPEYDGDPYTFKVSTASPMLTVEDYATLLAGVTSSKNARSHLAAIVVENGLDASPAACGVAQIVADFSGGLVLEVKPVPEAMQVCGVAQIVAEFSGGMPDLSVECEPMAVSAAGLAIMYESRGA